MIVEHIVSSINLFLVCAGINFTGRLEVIPTFVIAVVIFCTAENNFQVVIII